MTSTDRARLIASVALALGKTQRAQLLPVWIAQRVVARGADTTMLLELSSWLRDGAVIERHEGQLARAEDLDRRAAALSELGLEVLAAGGWPSIVDHAPASALATWNAAREALRAAHRVQETPPPPAVGVEVEVDMRAKVMTVRMDQRALIDDWSAHTVVAPGEHDDGWPMIAGRIYGDPRCAEGAALTIYGVASADERTLFGIDMDYALGRKVGRKP